MLLRAKTSFELASPLQNNTVGLDSNAGHDRIIAANRDARTIGAIYKTVGADITLIDADHETDDSGHGDRVA